MIDMDGHKTINTMLNDGKGFVTSTQVSEAGLQRRLLSELIESKAIYRVARGIYALPDVWEDEMYFLQYRFSKGIFSNETALYLHDMTDRTPANYTMTFPHGYNAKGIKKAGVIAKFVISQNYDFGIIEIVSPCDNPIRVYDRERTLCDIVKGNNSCDIQLVNQAMKMYASSTDKNISKLITYAEQLRVKPKILRYMEVLL
jgi:predicted transcriptional regulator of viral defense system